MKILDNDLENTMKLKEIENLESRNDVTFSRLVELSPSEEVITSLYARTSQGELRVIYVEYACYKEFLDLMGTILLRDRAGKAKRLVLDKLIVLGEWDLVYPAFFNTKDQKTVELFCKALKYIPQAQAVQFINEQWEIIKSEEKKYHMYPLLEACAVYGLTDKLLDLSLSEVYNFRVLTHLLDMGRADLAESIFWNEFEKEIPNSICWTPYCEWYYRTGKLALNLEKVIEVLQLVRQTKEYTDNHGWLLNSVYSQISKDKYSNIPFRRKQLTDLRKFSHLFKNPPLERVNLELWKQDEYSTWV